MNAPILDPARLHALQQRLQQRARQLEAELAVAHERWREGVEGDHEDVTDLKDLATEKVQAEADAGEAERDLGELNAVRAALERIAAGRYGLCIDCGEPIAAARLDVVPEAPRCAACQQVAEQGPRR